MWRLNSLSDVVSVHEFLEVGNLYECLGVVGNGLIIQTSRKDNDGNPNLNVVVMKDRFTRV